MATEENIFTSTQQTMTSELSDDVTPTNRTGACLRDKLNYVLQDDCATHWFYFCTVVGGSICVLGILANTISVFVLRKDKQAPVASMLLQALAIADNFFLVWWLLHYSLKNLLLYCGYRNWSNHYLSWAAIYLYPFLFIAQTWTVWLTVFIALTRYFAVCKPYKAFWTRQKGTVLRGILFSFLTSFLYNVPHFFDYTLDVLKHCNLELFLPRPRLTASPVYSKVYVEVMYYIFSFALPLLVLVFLNLHLMFAYKQVRQRRLRMLNPRASTDVRASRSDVRGAETRGNTENYRDQNITLITIIIVLIFILCHLPAKLVQMFYRYEHQQKCNSLAFILIEVSKISELLCSSTNFAVYCLFRHQFRSILRGRRCICGASTAAPLQQQTPFPPSPNPASVSLMNGNHRTQQTDANT